MSLEVVGLEVRYGSQVALDGVSLAIAASESVALLGPNGAGKTSLVEAIAGLRPVSGGSVVHRRITVTGWSTAERVRHGLVLVPSGRIVFAGLSVADNLLAACHQFAWDQALVVERVDGVIALFPVLGDRMRQRAGTLSGGEQQMLALAKGLILAPDVLLVDELTLGLAPAVVQELLAVLAGLATTLLLVCQSPLVAQAVAERAVWLEKGVIRFDGPIAQLRS